MKKIAAKLAHVFVAFAILVSVPGAATAVSVSSDQGYGWQVASRQLPNGADTTGKLSSTKGNKVYYSGRVDLSNSTDQVVGRYSIDTTSSMTVNGSIAGIFGKWTKKQGVRARVCQNIRFRQDKCGSWSSRF